MPRDVLILILAVTVAGGEFECLGQNSDLSKQSIQPIVRITREFEEKELLEDYSIREGYWENAQNDQGQQHYVATKCYRSETIPGVAYNCMKGEFDILEPPFPLAIPQKFQWKDSNGFDWDRDLGFVPIADAKDG